MSECLVFAVVCKLFRNFHNQIVILLTNRPFFNVYIIIIGSGGYSNLGARGKNFQKLMLSEKKKRSDLGLHIFLAKSKCSLKKKKKVFTSISSLISLFFSQNQGVLQKKKVFTPNRPLSKHLQRIQNCICCFRGGA